MFCSGAADGSSEIILKDAKCKFQEVLVFSDSVGWRFDYLLFISKATIFPFHATLFFCSTPFYFTALHLSDDTKKTKAYKTTLR